MHIYGKYTCKILNMRSVFLHACQSKQPQQALLSTLKPEIPIQLSLL